MAKIKPGRSWNDRLGCLSWLLGSLSKTIETNSVEEKMMTEYERKKSRETKVEKESKAKLYFMTSNQ